MEVRLYNTISDSTKSAKPGILAKKVLCHITDPSSSIALVILAYQPHLQTRRRRFLCASQYSLFSENLGKRHCHKNKVPNTLLVISRMPQYQTDTITPQSMCSAIAIWINASPNKPRTSSVPADLKS